jgi:hypothetical protein
MKLGSVDEPLCHTGDLVTGPNPIPPYLVQLVSNTMSPLSMTDTSASPKEGATLNELRSKHNPDSML